MVFEAYSLLLFTPVWDIRTKIIETKGYNF